MLIIFSLLLLVVGVVYNTVIGQASMNWPYVQGRIIESYIKEKKKKGKVRYKLRIRYEYLVDRERYEGRIVQYGKGLSFRSKDEAELALSHYQLGSEVSVYFMPKKPQYSCLVRGLD